MLCMVTQYAGHILAKVLEVTKEMKINLLSHKVVSWMARLYFDLYIHVYMYMYVHCSFSCAP